MPGAGLNLDGVVTNPIDGVHMTNCTAGGNVQHGIWVKSNCKNIDIDNVTTSGNSATFNDFTRKPTNTINTCSGVMVDDGNNIGVSIVGGRSGAVGAWDGAAPTQKYGYVFGSNTDYCGLFGATASGPTGPVRNATAALLNSSTGTHNQINYPLGNKDQESQLPQETRVSQRLGPAGSQTGSPQPRTSRRTAQH
jgi:hypothetical protein